MRDPEGFSWANRRRVVWATLLFCAGVMVYSLGWGRDTALFETAVTMSFLTGTATVGSYAFGAAWENRSPQARSAGIRPAAYADQGDV